MRYLYKCKKCGRDFEIIADMMAITKMSKQCPHCKSEKTTRIFFPIDFILKGRGFYKNDNKE